MAGVVGCTALVVAVGVVGVVGCTAAVVVAVVGAGVRVDAGAGAMLVVARAGAVVGHRVCPRPALLATLTNLASADVGSAGTRSSVEGSGRNSRKPGKELHSPYSLQARSLISASVCRRCGGVNSGRCANQPPSLDRGNVRCPASA